MSNKKLSPMEKFKAIFGTEEAVPCCWFNLPCVESVEIAAEMGFPMAVIDLEHTVISLETAQKQMMAMKGTSMKPFVRLPERSTGLTKRVLDMGASGLLLPYVESVEEVKQAIEDMKYPPEGKRGLSAYISRCGNYGMNAKAYVEKWRDTGFLMVMIESQKGLDIVEELAALDGVDGILFGTNDFALDCGVSGEADPVVEAAFERISAATAAHGKILACHPFGNKDLKTIIDAGCKLVGAANDVYALQNSWRASLERFGR
ncbi:HpcH/HpaI aldolase family protein [Polycladidibacter stylochi]|uniref:HpcH/HpaI aldolase family protein n=1 Tax=Polycladidibacter stylochi TaxID=1807766 RepID=UPI000834DAC1|nr:aldolase/citrate lyase family protein [Pseudovibrio stylochi]